MSQAPLETEEDLQLVKEYILLPILLDVLDRDIQTLGEVRLRMDAIYVRVLRHVQERVVADAALLRVKMRGRGVKVYDQKRTALGMEARYLCRGYHHQFSMLWGLVKAELSDILSVYLHMDVGIDR